MPPDQTIPAWVYELNLVPALFGPWAREFIAFVEPKQRSGKQVARGAVEHARLDDRG